MTVFPGLDVSRETGDRLAAFVDLVRKWNPTINLIGRSTEGDIWSRHVADSAQIFRLADVTSGHWLDLGSGGGFPGIVLAILAEDTQLRFTLVEADQRKATFLRIAIRALELPTKVLAQRIEALPPQQADVISARALAPLPKLCALAQPHLASNGICLFPKGAGHAEEVAQARKNWMMATEVHPSRTDPQAVILKLKDLAHV